MHGHKLSPELVEELMCEAERAFVLQDHLKPGRVHMTDPKRLFAGKLRRLLEERDGGCAFPGCGRKPHRTHAHHILAWSKGGPTTLANGVLLCGHHHRVIHQGRRTVRIAGDGKPEFIPPHYIDPDRHPLHHP